MIRGAAWRTPPHLWGKPECRVNPGGEQRLHSPRGGRIHRRLRLASLLNLCSAPCARQSRRNAGGHDASRAASGNRRSALTLVLALLGGRKS
jgi:hypothetical protein